MVTFKIVQCHPGLTRNVSLKTRSCS